MRHRGLLTPPTPHPPTPTRPLVLLPSLLDFMWDFGVEVLIWPESATLSGSLCSPPAAGPRFSIPPPPRPRIFRWCESNRLPVRSEKQLRQLKRVRNPTGGCRRRGGGTFAGSCRRSQRSRLTKPSGTNMAVQFIRMHQPIRTAPPPCCQSAIQFS